MGIGHVFHTVTAGSANTWVDISANLPNAPVQSVLVDPRNPGTIYVGTASGVYVCTTCGGASPSPSWARAGSGLPNVWVDDVTFTQDDSSVVAWTHGRGVWALSTPDTHTKTMSFAGTVDPYTI